MRIAFVVTNLAGGGAEKAVSNLAVALHAQGHRVDMVLLERIAAHALPDAIALHALTDEGKPLVKGWVGKRLAARKLSRLFARLAREQPFDLVVSTLPFADEVAIGARLPRHWCRIANTLSAEVGRLATRDRRKAARRAARYRRLYASRPLIAVSQGVSEDLRNALGLASTRIEIIPNPFDFAELRTRAAEQTELPHGPFVIHIGRYAAQKRHDLLLDAFARLHTQHRLVLLAQADPGLMRLIAERRLGDRVVVAGFKQNPYPWIAAADLLVLASDYEGLPNAIIEALVLGVPVVSTDCRSGPAEILGDALREWLVPVGDTNALAGAMARALTDPPDLSRVDLARYATSEVVGAYERLARQKV